MDEMISQGKWWDPSGDCHCDLRSQCLCLVTQVFVSCLAPGL